MSGIAIIGELLRADAPLLTVIPAGSIKAGRLPDGVGLPVLLVRTVSSVERQRLKRGTIVRYVDRISVAVRARNYREQGEVLRLVRSACAGKLGTIADCQRVSVLAAGTGPDIAGPGDSYEQTQDFRVTYDAQG